jgi:hypothetical protein
VPVTDARHLRIGRPGDRQQRRAAECRDDLATRKQ